jgi:hypothetical protein
LADILKSGREKQSPRERERELRKTKELGYEAGGHQEKDDARSLRTGKDLVKAHNLLKSNLPSEVGKNQLKIVAT